MSDLSKIKQQKAFKVPKNYFQNLDNRVLEKILPKEDERAMNWFDLLIYQLQLRFSIPALMVASLALIVIYVSLEQEKEALTYSDMEIRNYLIDEYDDEIEEQIYAYVLSEDKAANTISDEDILEYLSEEDLDLELINDYLP